MRCPKCGHEQPEAPECVRCGIVVARFDPASDPLNRPASASAQHDRQVAAEYQKRSRANRRAAGITLTTGVTASALVFLLSREPGPPVYIFVATVFIIIALSAVMLRCPNCSRIVGGPDALRCPHCQAVLLWVALRPRPDTRVVGEFERRLQRVSRLRLIQRVFIVIALVLFAGTMAANVIPPSLEEPMALGTFVLFIAVTLVLYAAQRRIYRCPRCGRALFDDADDSSPPLTDIDSCPFCGERLAT